MEQPSQLADVHALTLPAVVDRAAFQAEVDALRIREKTHTREGDTLAAARRRLPMVEVDSTTALIGPEGPVTVLDAFEGRGQLLAYYFMWYPGKPAAEQCEGCTLYNGQVRVLSYLHSRDVTYATVLLRALRGVASARSRPLRRPWERTGLSGLNLVRRH